MTTKTQTFLNDEFIKTASPRLYKMLRARFFPLARETAEDVLQQAWLKAFRLQGSFKGECSPHSWVYKIATSTAFDEISGKKKIIRHEVEEQCVVDGEMLSLERPDNTNPLNELIAMQAAEAISRISDNKCVALALEQASEDISYKEMAQRHNLALGTVQSRISRGREAILAAIGEGPALKI